MGNVSISRARLDIALACDELRDLCCTEIVLTGVRLRQSDTTDMSVVEFVHEYLTYRGIDRLRDMLCQFCNGTPKCADIGLVLADAPDSEVAARLQFSGEGAKLCCLTNGLKKWPGTESDVLELLVNILDSVGLNETRDIVSTACCALIPTNPITPVTVTIPDAPPIDVTVPDVPASPPVEVLTPCSNPFLPTSTGPTIGIPRSVPKTDAPALIKLATKDERAQAVMKRAIADGIKRGKGSDFSLLVSMIAVSYTESGVTWWRPTGPRTAAEIGAFAPDAVDCTPSHIMAGIEFDQFAGDPNVYVTKRGVPTLPTDAADKGISVGAIDPGAMVHGGFRYRIKDLGGDPAAAWFVWCLRWERKDVLPIFALGPTSMDLGGGLSPYVSGATPTDDTRDRGVGQADMWDWFVTTEPKDYVNRDTYLRHAPFPADDPGRDNCIRWLINQTGKGFAPIYYDGHYQFNLARAMKIASGL